jgi:hypothetical protein
MSPTTTLGCIHSNTTPPLLCVPQDPSHHSAPRAPSHQSAPQAPSHHSTPRDPSHQSAPRDPSHHFQWCNKEICSLKKACISWIILDKVVLQQRSYKACKIYETHKNTPPYPVTSPRDNHNNTCSDPTMATEISVRSGGLTLCRFSVPAPLQC